MQQNYSTQKQELLDKHPTCLHLQREPQVVQSAEKPYCSGSRGANGIATNLVEEFAAIHSIYDTLW
jgi:hypothetical protein